jgi:hypothetical protein
MLSNEHFYFKLLRKYVIVMGNMFNNINLIRTSAADDTLEVERFKVPIEYGPKEKYVTRLQTDSNLLKETQTTLPRMSFEITDINYDANRQQNPLLKLAKAEDASRVAHQYMGTPYNIGFDLNIYARNVDDGNHIIEQIVPYFHPDFTVTTIPVPTLGYLKDIPIVLNDVSPSITYEGNWESVRYVYWTLKFTVKGYFFGPITTPKIIRKSIANIFNDPNLFAGATVRINTSNGNNGTFGIKDVVYQGNRYETATAYGIVTHWSPDTGKLTIGGAQGQFRVNSAIRCASTNANYILESFDTSPMKLTQITVEPDPIDAEPEDDFGYTETIIEYPETIGANT